MKPRLYLSAPCSGYEDAERDEYFGKWQKYFESFGFSVFNPRKNGLNPSQNWTEHMKKDLAELCKSDFIVRISAAASRGVCLELHVANELAIPVITFDEIIRCNSNAEKLEYLFS